MNESTAVRAAAPAVPSKIADRLLDFGGGFGLTVFDGGLERARHDPGDHQKHENVRVLTDQ